MAVVGRALLFIAFVVSIWGAVASVAGYLTGRHDLASSARRAMPAMMLLLVASFGILEIAFLRDDFAFQVVATHSSTSTPTFYKAAAAWSSQEGSLLLWAMLLSIWSTIALRVVRGRLTEVVPVATAVLFILAAAFVGMTVFLADPFVTLAQVPAEGTGLNPLLRHASMMIHPPALYSGYTLFSIPFAFAIGALITKRLGADWLLATRRFALGAWLALGLGILLGARWSYTELGWGGYWAWDAVENAALLPWLLGTAYLHSATIQEKRGMLKIWNVSLVLGAGVLSILGTFLVRSGILSSIHAFVEPGAALRWTFVAMIVIELGVSIGLVISRRDLLKTEHHLDSLFSREAFFLAQNLVLVALTFVVMWGTFFPLVSEAITGTKTSVGPPWFDRYVGPLALVLVALTGIGPLAAWRKSGFRQLGKSIVRPAIFAVAVGVTLFVVAPTVRSDFAALLLFTLAALVFGTVFQEFLRGVKARRAMAAESAPVALVHLVQRNRRRYGGYVVHVGFVVLLCGVAGSSSFQEVTEKSLKPGQSITTKGYKLTYTKPLAEVSRESVDFGAEMIVTSNGKPDGTIESLKGWYPANSQINVADQFEGETETEVGLRAGVFRDLWLAVEPDTSGVQPLVSRLDKMLAALPLKQIPPVMVVNLRDRGTNKVATTWAASSPPVTFRVVVSPMVTWIWVGGIIVALGGLIAIWPAGVRSRRRVKVSEAASGSQGQA